MIKEEPDAKQMKSTTAEKKTDITNKKEPATKQVVPATAEDNRAESEINKDSALSHPTPISVEQKKVGNASKKEPTLK